MAFNRGFVPTADYNEGGRPRRGFRTRRDLDNPGQEPYRVPHSQIPAGGFPQKKKFPQVPAVPAVKPESQYEKVKNYVGQMASGGLNYLKNKFGYGKVEVEPSSYTPQYNAGAIASTPANPANPTNPNMPPYGTDITEDIPKAPPVEPKYGGRGNEVPDRRDSKFFNKNFRSKFYNKNLKGRT
jgi:hypothetical protein